MKPKIIALVYVASKTRFAGWWQTCRSAWSEFGLQVSSSWIDEVGEGESDLAQLWPRIFEEIHRSDFLIAYHEDGDVWKGAYAEIGAALVLHKPVYFVGMPQGTLHHHPLVTIAASTEDAIEDWRAFHLQMEWPT